MAAWRHVSYWNEGVYGRYRTYVTYRALQFRGRTDLDCADMSIILLIEFAALHTLPLTFWDNNQVRYISKAKRQTPKDSRLLRSYSWKSTAEYIRAVRNRVGASALLRQNTVPNSRGPQPGDLMASGDHTALIYAVYPPTVEHPRAADRRIPIFPGRVQAAKETFQTEYFRSGETEAVPVVHFDYLNHRGEGKEAAELMYFASADAMRREGFQYRMYKPGVTDNWREWNGDADPPR
jgi:hypothetical protein